MSENNVIMNMQVAGVAEYKANCRDMADAAIEIQRRIEYASQNSEVRQAKIAERAAAAKIKAGEKYAKQMFDLLEKEEKATVNSATRKANADIKGAIEALQGKTRAREAYNQANASYWMAERRQAAEAAAEQKRIDKQTTSDHEAELKKRAKSDKQTAREVNRAHAEAMQDVARENSERSDRYRNIGRGALSNMSAIGRGVGSVARGVLQVGGGFGIADSVQREVSLHAQAADIAAQAPKTEDGRYMTSKEFFDPARRIAMANGLDQEDVLEGMKAANKLTGNSELTLSAMPEIAKKAVATGSKVSELASTFANITSANQTMSKDDAMGVMSVLTMQGMRGGVDMEDMAKHGSRLVAGAGYYSGDQTENIGVAGAMAQIARQHGGASSAAEAALASQRFASDSIAHADTLRKSPYHIEVMENGRLKGGRAIMSAMIEGTGGDFEKLMKLGLGQRGDRVLLGGADIYKKAGGGEAGKLAVQKEFDKFSEGMSSQEQSDRFNARMAEPDKQLEIAMERLKNTVGEKLLPELQKLIPILANAAPEFGRLVEVLGKTVAWLAENPWLGLGAAAGAAITKSVIDAAIGETVKAVITGSALSSFGLAGIAAGGFAIAVGAAVIAINGEVDKMNKKSQQESAAHLTDANLIEHINNGVATDAEIDEAKKRLPKLGKELEQAQKDNQYPSLSTDFLARVSEDIQKIGYYTGVPGATDPNKSDGADLRSIDLENRKTAVQNLTTDFENLSKAIKKSDLTAGPHVAVERALPLAARP